MSNPGSLFQNHRHLVSFYDEQEDKQINLETLRQLAKYFLLEGYGVIYGAEPFETAGNKDPHKIIANRIFQSKGKLDNASAENSDIRPPYKQQKAMDKLMIIDPYAMFSDDYTPADIIDYWSSQYSKASERFGLENNNVKGIIGINIPDPYFEKKTI